MPSVCSAYQELRDQVVDKAGCICNYICVYRLRFAKSVVGDPQRLRAYDRQGIVEAIEKQLREEPVRPTRNRKLLVNLIPPWTAELPVWELRVGDYRVFYDISQEDETVYVRAVRKKPPGKSTEEML
jgi:mRNA-degrading endonuclease RelE of RelBE toxin-antitoxin system